MVVSATVVEDYVKVIHGYTEWQPQRITTTVLAARLGLANSSVTEMVKKLVAQGLVSHEPYGAIELTPEGTELALRMVRRHRLIETWLVERLGYRWDEVHDEAEVLEHAVSDRLLDALDDELGHPVRDPHGDPIPARDGTVVKPDAHLLADLAAGTPARVARISDRDPAVLRHLEAEGITLDVALEVLQSTGESAVVSLAGQRVALATEALSSIWVVLD
ncbi:metal-dependent transcriptional regulator [Antiquaquibacter soli]|uniref:Manganese transport regulator n=1 Tax=Antiquaquibacter soli TaxID=3064523 RepID=A0ABT9BPQ4_9MICO|nr:metal-dependent transcriptional regulator [Protaetiibacter sp. WY-16]MDO7881395.1 metal-dependent transcriptional regulator [Protaetiibacter sp. WY-16]